MNIEFINRARPANPRFAALNLSELIDNICWNRKKKSYTFDMIG